MRPSFSPLRLLPFDSFHISFALLLRTFVCGSVFMFSGFSLLCFLHFVGFYIICFIGDLTWFFFFFLFQPFRANLFIIPSRCRLYNNYQAVNVETH